MSERENDNLEPAVEPSEDQPRGDDEMSLEPPSDANAAVDPPVDQPGGGSIQ